ncbi:MAG: polyphosphate kinase 2 family protein [Myxococcales bacterium]|nr:polyphosphate kinase 2 family protein [Myxococcales bacterium]MCB9577958.1 polyphosphate kinase 2 family protein [Polyangiaceae bacterium]
MAKHEPVESPYLVPFDGSFRVDKAKTQPPKSMADKHQNKKQLKKQIKQMRELQQQLYAHDRYSLLLVFQAMDAAGKDGTIRAVMSGVNPAGCQVYSFKKPSEEALDHDFMWRIYRALPERGRIGIFNRSHYEEVLVVRVHPEFLRYQKLPEPIDEKKLWKQRYDSIRSIEKHWVDNGTRVLKFWLNVSRDEQRQRFLDRIDDPEANWKFSATDVEERKHWDAYMDAYEEALNQTSRPWAPWYSIPADDKPFMRRVVADIVVRTLKSMGLKYPSVTADERKKLLERRAELLE